MALKEKIQEHAKKAALVGAAAATVGGGLSSCMVGADGSWAIHPDAAYAAAGVAREVIHHNGNGRYHGGYGNGSWGGWTPGYGGGYGYSGAPGSRRTSMVVDAYGNLHRGETSVNRRPVAYVYHHAPDDMVEVLVDGQKILVDKKVSKEIPADAKVYQDEKSGQSMVVSPDVLSELESGKLYMGFDEAGRQTIVPGEFKKGLESGQLGIFTGKGDNSCVVSEMAYKALVEGKASIGKDGQLKLTKAGDTHLKQAQIKKNEGR